MCSECHYQYLLSGHLMDIGAIQVLRNQRCERNAVGGGMVSDFTDKSVTKM